MSSVKKEWLSSNQAASQIGITQRTLYRFIDEGRLPGYRIGRVIRLRQLDVQEFLEECLVKPGELKHLYPDSEQINE